MIQYSQFIFKACKYTFSQKGNNRRDVSGEIGIGWSSEGMQKFNDLYYQIYEDRLKRGDDFINGLKDFFRKNYFDDDFGKKPKKHAKQKSSASN